MMNAFRNSAKPVLVVLAITMFLWLVYDLSGLSNGTGLMTKTSAGKVNGTALDVRTYEAAVQRAIDDRQRQSSGRLSLEAVQQIRDEVFEEYVQTTLLEKEFEARGIEASDEEVVEALRGSPPSEFLSLPDFQTEKKFDPAKYQRWLTSSSARPYVDGLAGSYREQLRRAKLFRRVSADVFRSDAALWQQYRDQNEQVTVGIAYLAPKAVSDAAIDISPADAEQFYRSHQDTFKRPRTAYLSFVSVPRVTDASDTAAALAHAKKLREEIVAGAPFAEVARRESADSVSAAKGGDLGEWNYGAMDKAFDAAAMQLKPGQLSEPVLSAFGWHLIELTSRSGNKLKGRHILVPVALAGAHRDRVDAQADSLERLAAESGDRAALDTVAKALRTPVQQLDPVAEGERAHRGPLVVPDAGVWAFQHPVGSLSPVVETPYAYFVFRLDSLLPAGVPPFAAVKEAARRAAWVDREMKAAKTRAQQLAERRSKGGSLKELAAAAGAEYSVQGPFSRLNPPVREPVLIGAAFGVAPGEATGVIETKSGYYVLEGIGRANPDSTKFAQQVGALREQAAQAARQERVKGWMASLRAGADVKDYRADLQQAQPAKRAS